MSVEIGNGKVQRQPAQYQSAVNTSAAGEAKCNGLLMIGFKGSSEFC